MIRESLCNFFRGRGRDVLTQHSGHVLLNTFFLVYVASENPRNWGRHKKWRQIVMVSFFTLMRYAIPVRQELVTCHMRFLQPNSIKYACTSTPRDLKRAEDAPRNRDKVRSIHSGMFCAMQIRSGFSALLSLSFSIFVLAYAVGPL